MESGSTETKMGTDSLSNRGRGQAIEATLAGEKRGKVPRNLEMTLYDFRHFFCSEHAAPGPQHMEVDSLAAYIGHSPGSRETLLRWYTDQDALRRGAPVSLMETTKEGRIMEMGGRPGDA